MRKKFGLDIKILLIVAITFSIVSFFVLFKINTFIKGNNISTNIPVSIRDWIEIPLTLNSHNTFGVFDTGSNICVVDESSLQKYKIIKLPIKIPVNWSKWQSVVVIRHLKIGDFFFKNVIAIAVDLKSESKVLERINSDIIIGTPIINKLVWMFNLNKKELTVSTGSPINISETKFKSFSFQGKFLYNIIVQVNFIKHKVIIDFGHSSSLILPLKYAPKQFGIQYETINKKDINGRYHDKVILSNSDVIFGSDTLRNMLVEYSDKNANILGFNFFKNYNEIIIDPYARMIHLGSQIRIKDELKFKGFGFNINFIDSNLVITSIFDKSPAQKAGLLIGDKILSINGVSASSFLAYDYSTYIEKSDSIFIQKTIELTVKREKPFRVVLERNTFN